MKYLRVLIVLIFASIILCCSKVYYQNPVEEFVKTKGVTFTGRYEPMSEQIEFVYSKKGKVFHGEFQWNQFFEDDYPEFTSKFDPYLFSSSNFIIGKFNKGSLNGEVILCRISSSVAENYNTDTVGMYTFQDGVLHGDFYLAKNSKKYIYGTYCNGFLEGELFHKESLGTFNGTPGLFTDKWILKYKSGKFDGIQTRYRNDTIVESAYFERGIFKRSVNNVGIDGFTKILDKSIYHLKSSSLYYSLIGRMLEVDHTSRIREVNFGDSTFNGVIEFCDGQICKDVIIVDRILKYSPLEIQSDTFRILEL